MEVICIVGADGTHAMALGAAASSSRAGYVVQVFRFFTAFPVTVAAVAPLFVWPAMPEIAEMRRP